MKFQSEFTRFQFELIEIFEFWQVLSKDSIMDPTKYSNVYHYLNMGTIPPAIPLNRRHNFISTASQYRIQAGKLMRQGKQVVKQAELDELWDEMHT